MTKRKIKKAYTRERTQTSVASTKTKTIQSEKHSSDINNIMAKAYKTGTLPVLMNRKEVEPLPGCQTYQDALNKVVHAQQEFERLPAEVRIKFDNDPANLLSAVEASEKNEGIKKELQMLGIVEKSVAPPVPAEQSGAAANGGAATAKQSDAPDPTSAPAENTNA